MVNASEFECDYHRKYLEMDLNLKNFFRYHLSGQGVDQEMIQDVWSYD